jgi:hypothetical protein
MVCQRGFKGMNMHQVREIILKLVVEDDGPDGNFFVDSLCENMHDSLVSIELVNTGEVRDATIQEAESMAWEFDDEPV